MSNVPSLVVCRKLQQQANYDSLLGQAAGEDKGTAFQQRSTVRTGRSEADSARGSNCRCDRGDPTHSPSRVAWQPRCCRHGDLGRERATQAGGSSLSRGGCVQFQNAFFGSGLAFPKQGLRKECKSFPWDPGPMRCEPASAPFPWPVSASGFELGEEGQSS